MVNLGSLKRIAEKAKRQVDKRGGTDALREDAEELKSMPSARAASRTRRRRPVRR
jgi:hypothetical protein